jgi:hypothetical protein
MTRIIRNPRVIWDVVDGVMTLCHLGSTEIYSLNETGAAVWEACDDTPEAILSRVREQYPDQASETIDATVRDFLSALETASLILLQQEQTVGAE